ncbi:hypothetical protein M404DRAFT_940177 [Pisolithus tinctorius Marx 270]|uniref:Uncharacterized protein n=1 Tax=Pisolithus tinctorius Marx 270 TaxID=870435 RepID=A0A0C3P3N1_PISTI|nr:hypothetical protein M404DRAFT_940177 [Pisolithus tinctorius Marx 270]
MLVKTVVGCEKLLFWLEALSLLDGLGHAMSALASSISWLQVGEADVLILAQDGIKFVHNFGNVISHSTPHLYISALPFTPSNTKLSRLLMPKFSQLVGVSVGGKKEWPAAQVALQGHTSSVQSVGFSSDGRRVVSGSSDNTMRIWDAERGVQIGGPLEGHTSSVQIWDAERGVQIGGPLEGHIDWVNSVGFSSDGRRIVMRSEIKVADACAHEDGQYQPVKLFNDGWIGGPRGRLLLWIPPTFWNEFYSMWNTMVIPRGGIELDLSQMVHGNKWQQCFNATV